MNKVPSKDRTMIAFDQSGKGPALILVDLKELGDVLPNAQRRTLEGQTHMVRAKVVAPLLVEFFKG
jgi:hypothetical protein